MICSIILVNYNGHFDTVECLESLLKQDFINFKIFVLDNSENEDSINYIEDWAKGNVNYVKTSFPEIIFPLVNKPIDYVRLERIEFEKESNFKKLVLVKAENNGFAAANNIIIKKIISSENDDHLIWILNNDTVVPKNALINLIKEYQTKEKIGIFGTKLYYYDNPNFIQCVGGDINPYTGIVKEVLEGESIHSIKNHKKIDFACGASMFTNVRFVKSVGLMEEKYFLYFEEPDWTLRGKQKGWETDYSDQVFIYHKVSKSIKGNNKMNKSLLADYYFIKNRILFMKKFYQNRMLFVYLSILISFVNRLIRRRLDLCKQILVIIFYPNKCKIYK